MIEDYSTESNSYQTSQQDVNDINKFLNLDLNQQTKIEETDIKMENSYNYGTGEHDSINFG